MYEDDSISDLSNALEQKIVELLQARQSKEAVLYIDAQDRLRAWWDAGQPGELPTEVRNLTAVAWEAILRPLPVAKESVADANEQEDDLFDPPPTEMADVLAALKRIEDRLVAGQMPPALIPEAPPRAPSLLPLWVTLLLVGLLLALLILWRTESSGLAQTILTPIESALNKLPTSLAGLAVSNQVIMTTALPPIQTGIAQMATDIATLKNAISENALSVENGQIQVVLNANEEALQQLAQSLAATVATIAVTQTAVAAERATAETNLLATQTAIAGEVAAIQATAIAVSTASAAVDTKQAQVNTQSTVSAQNVERARTTATALITGAMATATAIAGISSAQGNPTAVAPTATPTPTPTPTPTLAATPTPTPVAAVGQFVISFPPENANFYVAPWQVEVTVTEWLANATQYRLLLDGVELTTFTGDENTPLTYIAYERAFVDGGLFDGFPRVDDGEAAALKLDPNRQLPAGTHTFTLQAQVEGNWSTVAERTFTITADPPIRANEIISVNLTRRIGPSQASPTDPPSGLPSDTVTQVNLLGKTAGFYKDPTVATATLDPVEWVLWETTDDNPRRGWAPARFFNFLDGATIDDVPVIAPPQPN